MNPKRKLIPCIVAACLYMVVAAVCLSPAFGQKDAPGVSQKTLDQKLIAVVNARHAATVRRLLRAGADVNAVGAVGGEADNPVFPGTKTPALVIAVCLGDTPTLNRYSDSNSVRVNLGHVLCEDIPLSVSESRGDDFADTIGKIASWNG